MTSPTRLASVLALLVSAGCQPGEAPLLVELRSDLRPGIEVRSVTVELHRSLDAGDPERTTEPLVVSEEADLVAGHRIAELDAVPSGDWVLRVHLRDASGAEIGGRVLATQTAGQPQVVTAVVTRSCRDVACPGDGSPSAVACLGGTCVEPGCTPENPSACPAADCASDADCPGGPVACAVGACRDGTCLVEADDGTCPGATCLPDRGCVAWSAVDAAGAHTCALRDGDAYCWGTARGGQTVLVPTLVAGLPRGLVTQVDAGVDHACAIAEGRAFCWGGGVLGQLGDDTARDSDAPVEVVGLPSPVRQISAGFGFTCAIAGDGVFCWGNGSQGRLGAGTGVANSPVPIEVMLGPDDAALAQEVVAGGDHACLTLSDGRGLCWGHNDGGLALGAGTSDDFSDVPLETLATGLASIDIAGYHACGRTLTGGVLCWGMGADGMLGQGTTDGSGTPVEPAGLGADVTALGNGGGPDEYDTTCVVQAGAVLCFGSGAYGRIGVGTGEPALEPTPFEGLPGRAVSIALGWGHACALLDDGSLRCWGTGGQGELGDGAQTDVVTGAVRVADPP